jgi:tryptophan halogenase
MSLPESLKYKEEHFARSGRIVLSSDELFKDSSWFAVLLGQGHRAQDYNPLIDTIDSPSNLAHLARLKSEIKVIVSKMRDHQSFLAAT